MGEALTKGKVAGLVMGIIGVAVLVGWTTIALNGVVLVSVGASLLAAFSYALGGVYTKRAFADTPPLALAIGQQTGPRCFWFPWLPRASRLRRRRCR